MDFLLGSILGAILGCILILIYQNLKPKKKPVNRVERSVTFRNYTLEELYAHEKRLDRDVKVTFLHYPHNRKSAMDDLKVIRRDIEILEELDGTKALNDARKTRQAELDIFDKVFLLLENQTKEKK